MGLGRVGVGTHTDRGRPLLGLPQILGATYRVFAGVPSSIFKWGISLLVPKLIFQCYSFVYSHGGRKWTSGAFLSCSPPYFFVTGSHWTYPLQIWLDCLNKPRDSPDSAFPGSHHHKWFLMWVLGSASRSWCLRSKHVTNWAKCSSLASFLCSYISCLLTRKLLFFLRTHVSRV